MHKLIYCDLLLSHTIKWYYHCLTDSESSITLKSFHRLGFIHIVEFFMLYIYKRKQSMIAFPFPISERGAHMFRTIKFLTHFSYDVAYADLNRNILKTRVPMLCLGAFIWMINMPAINTRRFILMLQGWI